MTKKLQKKLHNRTVLELVKENELLSSEVEKLKQSVKNQDEYIARLVRKFEK